MCPVIIAHRGASGLFPENTLEAFQAAYRQRADGIELDVQLSLDQEVVVIHDSRLERTTNGEGLVRSYTLQELQHLKAGEWFHPRFRHARIPSLQEVFEFVQPTHLLVVLELKNFITVQPNLEEKVLQLIEQYQLEKRVIISSFNFNSLLHIKRLNPSIKTGLLYIGALRNPWLIAKEFHTEQIHAPQGEITPQLLKEAHRMNQEVYAWTVNSPHRMKRMFSLGVDGIITNYPARAKKLLKKK